MKERPIPMSAPMIRAILAGTKTVTRRILKPKYDCFVEDGRPFFASYVYGEPESIEVPCPYGAPGDRLWVREAWRTVASLDDVRPSLMDPTVSVRYEADGVVRGKLREPTGRYRHARFMPRAFSRITLNVVSVRVERLHAITEEDARAEGVGLAYRQDGPGTFAKDSARAAFEILWREINGKASWDANLWVWRIEFRRVEAER